MGCVQPAGSAIGRRFSWRYRVRWRDLGDAGWGPDTIASSLFIESGCERMWYAIEGHDGPDVLAQRVQARPQHLARLTALRDEGRLLLAGPCPAIDAEDPGPAGFSGSIVIAEFASLAAAREWADADPYIAAGVYQRVDVRPFRPVLP